MTTTCKLLFLAEINRDGTQWGDSLAINKVELINFFIVTLIEGWKNKYMLKSNHALVFNWYLKFLKSNKCQ